MDITNGNLSKIISSAIYWNEKWESLEKKADVCTK